MWKFFKIPTSETEEIKGLETWVVSWYSRYGAYSHDVEKCYQAFTSKENAIKFKKALEDAFKFIKHTHGDEVELKRQETGLGE